MRLSELIKENYNHAFLVVGGKSALIATLKDIDTKIFVDTNNYYKLDYVEKDMDINDFLDLFLNTFENDYVVRVRPNADKLFNIKYNDKIIKEGV
jgi:putative NADH-flavin reductase